MEMVGREPEVRVAEGPGLIFLRLPTWIGECSAIANQIVIGIQWFC